MLSITVQQHGDRRRALHLPFFEHCTCEQQQIHFEKSSSNVDRSQGDVEFLYDSKGLIPASSIFCFAKMGSILFGIYKEYRFRNKKTI